MAARTLFLCVFCILAGSTVAQFVFSSTNVCSMWFPGGSCTASNSTCPRGSKPVTDKSSSAHTLLCGAFGKVCCVSASPIDERNCGLGVPVRRILNGFPTAKCDWPFIVSIRGRVQSSLPLDQNTTQHVCAGVILDNKWVLTHALCLYTTNTLLSEVHNEFVVVAGEYRTDQIDVDPQFDGNQLEQFVSVEKGFVHPDFVKINYLIDVNLANNSLANGNALALLKLAEPMENRCASAACLPDAFPVQSSQTCDSFQQCAILGWGFQTADFQKQGNLTQGYVKLYTGDTCDLLKSAGGVGSAPFAGSACQTSDYNNDGCIGDLGGPVLCYDGNRFVVRGIIPFNLCFQGQTNPYVLDVASANKWIYDIIQANP